MSNRDLNNLNMPRMRMADGVMHCHPHSGVDVSVMIPSETRALTEEAMSMLKEVKRLLGKNVESVEQTTESTDDSGVNVLTFTFSDGTTQQFKIRNGRAGENGADGVDGNIAEIEEAIERANEAATKAEAADKLKEAYVKLVAVGLATTAAGTLNWGTYDPATMVRWTSQLLSSANQLQARTNIAAAGKAEFDVLANKISSLELLSDSKVGLYENLNTNLKTEAVTQGYQEGLPFVVILLNYLYSLIGNATLKTTAQDLKGAVNELYDLMPEEETTDIDMTNTVFYAI